MKKINKLFFVVFLFIIYILISISSYSNAVSNNLSDSVLRLHVIANSNSDEDQALKYAVRDELIEYMNSICLNISTKEEAVNLVTQNLDSFQKIAEDVIKQNGFNYNVNLEVGNFDFPSKKYGDISLPAGFYDALKVKIGNASGKNWWCVMFPSLCFVDVTNGIVPEESKETLQTVLEDEEYSLISSENYEYKFKFKLVELFENAKIILAQR